jgi:peptide/nickel transport system permease protein
MGLADCMRSRVLLAGAWLSAVLVLALLAPALPLIDPANVLPEASLSAPSRAHWLGTDLLGRDVFGRVLWGARRTLGMALLAALVTALPGAGLGLIAGQAGGATDAGLMRGADVMLALPQLLVALVAAATLGSNPWSVGAAVGVAGIAGFARLTRAAVQQVRVQNFILAAQAAGLSSPQIALRHVLPNIAGPLAALTSIHFAWAILSTATLTFLGFGGSPAIPDWGKMLNEGRGYFVTAPWVSTAPGLAIMLTVLSVNVLGKAWERAQRGRR